MKELRCETFQKLKRLCYERFGGATAYKVSGKKKLPKVFVPQLNNAGDLFNYDLLEFFDAQIEVITGVGNPDLLMLGSGISYLQDSSRPINKSPLHIWGTGFLYGDDIHDSLYRPNLIVHALRGQLSKEKLEGLLGKALPDSLPLADPGLLASSFVEESVAKKYAIGFIPHFREHGSDEVKYVLEHGEDVHYIDITQRPRDVIRAIQECDSIISSSLHGLVFSDSLHVANTHMRLTELPKGGSFKFRDYYSSFGLPDPALRIDDVVGLTSERIKMDYCVPPREVEKKKRLLIQTFPLNGAVLG